MNHITFDDVLIQPRFSNISSRKDVDTSINILGFPYMTLPVISANMDTITGPAMAKAMISYGAQACLHRFSSVEDNVKMFLDSRVGGTGGLNVPFVSVGLGNTELERAKALFDAGAITFIIDVAHGATQDVAKQAIELRALVKDKGTIVVGNFATAESIREFQRRSSCAADAYKIGIGPGSACTTRIKTGVGVPQLSAIMDCAATGEVIIADGGMRTPGDITKALAAGADMIMLGGMLSGTDETPGEVIWDREEEWLLPTGHKKYRGSASKESYEAQGKDASWRTAEGESFLVPYKGSVVDVLKDIEGGLRSAMTYTNSATLEDFWENASLIEVSNNSVKENHAHGKIN